MIGVLLLASSFLILIFLAVLFLAFSIKKWSYDRELENSRKFDELAKRIDDTQALFKNQVTELLSTMGKLISNGNQH
jgi:hypothetical protein